MTRIAYCTVPILACLLGCTMPAMGKDKAEVRYLRIAELTRKLELPWKCGETKAYEGSSVQVAGYVDTNNIFDKRREPNVSQDKFFIQDRVSGASLEVVVDTRNNAGFFDLLYRNLAAGKGFIMLNARVVGFDMPISNSCSRWIKVVMGESNDNMFAEKEERFDEK